METKKTTSDETGYRYGTDPTSLTTAQLLREIGSLKELVFTRLDAIEEGIKVAHQDLVRVPTEIQEQIGSLKELLETKIEKGAELKEEKFKNIDRQFQSIEQARIEHKNDTANAVDKAFGAAKEAVKEQNTANNIAISKSETAMNKQMDQQSEIIKQLTKNFDEKIADLKERVTFGGGKIAGYAQFIGWIIAAITIAGFIITNVNK